MAAEPTVMAVEVTERVQRQGQVRSAGVMLDYWALTKPEVNFLIAMTVFAGFELAGPPLLHGFPFLRLVHTLLGTLMVAGGTSTLNQYIERRFDAQMRRTARRPVAAGRLEPGRALRFGIALSVAGSVYLAVAVNALASLLAVLTLVSYLFVYTPLKRKTPLCTVVGAFPGAMPPLIGWAAASGTLSREAWLLYATLFLWQFPHFMAIAWMYREDYERAGYFVLPRGRGKGRFMAWQSLLASFALIPVSLATMLLRNIGLLYLVGALLLGAGFFYCGTQLVFHRSNAVARRLLFASIIYLPLVLALMMLNKG